jgi:anaerobic ribonucleoside-triphosphate reductase activating protein
MPELILTLDVVTGAVLLADPDRSPPGLHEQLAALFGPGRELGCARPLGVLPPPVVPARGASGSRHLRVAGYYHNSLVEGPGRRSSVLVAGCTLGCPGCWVPSLHALDGGCPVPVDLLADVVLDPFYERDGVSILGGEPFQQPEGLLALVRALRARGCPHLLAYSGHTYEQLRRMAERQPAIGAVLGDLDVLIDGPYVLARADTAGPWTGSGNQRVIDLAATRERGAVVPWHGPHGSE